MTSANRPKVLTEDLPTVRISPEMLKGLKTAAGEHLRTTPRGKRPVGMAQWIRDALADKLDQELPGWDE